jgi:hypothetical protein
MAIAFALANPARSLAQQAAGDPVGLWSSSTVINGVPVSQVSLNKADGTFACRTVCGGVVLDATGRYSYANGILTSIYDNGWIEQDSLVWVDANTVVSTCLQSNFPGCVGQQMVGKRLR